LAGPLASDAGQQALARGTEIILARKADWMPPDVTGGAAFAEVFTHLLHSAADHELLKPALCDLLELGLDLAREGACFAQVWSGISEWLFRDGLQAIQRPDLSRTLTMLGGLLLAEHENRGYLALLRWQLEHSQIGTGDMRERFLAEVAHACEESERPNDAAADMTKAADAAGDEDIIAQLCASFAAAGGEMLREAGARRYQQLITSMPDREQWLLRRRVAAWRGGADLLGVEFAEGLIPWDQSKGEARVSEWLRELQRLDSQVAVTVAQSVATSLRRRRNNTEALPALKTCVRKFRDTEVGGAKARSVLTEALVLLPSDLGGEDLGGLIRGVDLTEWCRAAQSAVEFERWIAQTKRLSESRDFDPACLIETYPDLAKVIDRLADDRWRAACELILQGMHDERLERRDSVAAVTRLILEPALCHTPERATSECMTGEGAERPLEASDLIGRQFRQALAPTDLCTRAYSASLAVLGNPQILASRQARASPQMTARRCIARIVAFVLRDGGRQTRQLLWARLETYPLNDVKSNRWYDEQYEFRTGKDRSRSGKDINAVPSGEEDWRQWLREFEEEVDAAASAIKESVGREPRAGTGPESGESAGKGLLGRIFRSKRSPTETDER
jgi:hypothetical protein